MAGDTGALAQEAGRAIGRPVKVVVGKSYAFLTAGLSAGSIQLAQLSPYMVLRAELESRVLVLERKAARDFFLAAHENPRLSAFLSARSVTRYVEPKRHLYEPLAREMRRMKRHE